MARRGTCNAADQLRLGGRVALSSGRVGLSAGGCEGGASVGDEATGAVDVPLAGGEPSADEAGEDADGAGEDGGTTPLAPSDHLSPRASRASVTAAAPATLSQESESKTLVTPVRSSSRRTVKLRW
jgi:hypothetical protein